MLNLRLTSKINSSLNFSQFDKLIIGRKLLLEQNKSNWFNEFSEKTFFILDAQQEDSHLSNKTISSDADISGIICNSIYFVVFVKVKRKGYSKQSQIPLSFKISPGNLKVVLENYTKIMRIFSKLTFNDYVDICETQNYGRVTDIQGKIITEENLISNWSPDYSYLSDIALVIESIFNAFKIICEMNEPDIDIYEYAEG